jgi:N-carbamoyl-L-amino-acid hydrolase
MVDVVADLPLFRKLMQEVSTFGATGRGGVHRLAASADEGRARDWLTEWLRQNDFDVRIDPLGNIMGILTLAGPDAPLVLSGSHLDSQPMGGRFDGAYGVVAAAVAAQSIRDALTRSRKPALANLGVVSWTNEEGARFQPSLIGSSFYAGKIAAEEALAITDGEGISLGSELEKIGYAGRDGLPKAHTYVELHVECGPELERAGRRLAVVTNWWGVIKVRLAFVGRQAHTGPTPMGDRHDASYAAGLILSGLRDMADALNEGPTERLFTSVGRLEVQPNSPNVVPALCRLFVELRSPDPDVLIAAEAELLGRIEVAADKARVRAEIEEISVRPAGRFNPGLIDLARKTSAALGEPAMELATIAGHDAIPLAGIARSIVVETPSVGGICHHEDEFTKPEDLDLGVEWLTRMLRSLVMTDLA